MNSAHIFIVAAEKSGDELGAGLVRALNERTKNNIKISAIGGSALEKLGLKSPVDISPLSILGFLEGLKSYPIIMDRVDQTCANIMKERPDAVVLIDSWGFMIRVAKKLKKQGFKGKIIKYVAPQVWAMREGRSKILAKYNDHVLSIHSFDAPYFTKHGLPVTYVGNPVFDQDYDTGDGKGLREKYKISNDTPVLVMLFGSRLSEIQNLAKPFADAVAILKRKMPDLAIVSPMSDTIAEDILAAASEYKALQDVIMLEEKLKLDCFAAADIAIACSGTVTSQLASAGIPTIVGYKLNALTYWIAKKLYKPDYISIINIAANKPLMPEFIQNDCNGENLADAALNYLEDSDKRKSASIALHNQAQKMRVQDKSGNNQTSSDRAAKAVLEIIS